MVGQCYFYLKCVLMRFFKQISTGYTLLELMITISIGAFFLICCYETHQRYQKRHLQHEHLYGPKKECLDFFARVFPFVCMTTQCSSKTTSTVTLTLLPTTENTAVRHFEIQLNGERGNKDLLNIRTKYIQSFSWACWHPQQHKWIKLNDRLNDLPSRFIKVTLWDKTQKPLDSFIFSCPMIIK